MKRVLMIALLGLILIGVAYWNLHNRPHGHGAQQMAAASGVAIGSSQTKFAAPMPAPSPGSASGSASGAAANEPAHDDLPYPAVVTPHSEIESLNTLAQVLFIATRPHQSMNGLVNYLKASAQDPYLVKNSNKYTGELTFVRTNSPFQGTRYFHAQYFSDQNSQPFAQHISFEFRPGPDSSKQVVDAIQKAFPNLGPAKTREKGNFTEWDAGGGYTVWTRKLTAEDIRRSNDPYSVHTADDVGTHLVVIEQNPEHGEE